LTDVPVHFSATSQVLAAARQTVDDGASASVGQTVDVPVHFSATSHVPAAARQTVDDEATPSAGQSSDVPPQVSATSHVPFAARQTVPAAMGEQVPTLPARLQDEQAPVQAVLQQMPLTQVSPDAH
jgi:hypothetical protein